MRTSAGVPSLDALSTTTTSQSSPACSTTPGRQVSSQRWLLNVGRTIVPALDGMGTGTDTHGAVPALSADAYYNQSRADLTALLPLPLGNVLDVGCGAGGVGQHLARRPGERLVGVEINAEQAALAAAHYDDVIVGSVPGAFDVVEGSFQPVLCYAVLEHLVAPATVLRTLSERLAAPDAVLHVSVPNARPLSLVRDLVFRGTFGYRPSGQDRKSTRLNSSHMSISYAVFCLKKKTKHHRPLPT